jgi:hypothetical protein
VQTSTKSFFKSLAKSWWLVVGVVGGLFFILDLIGLAPAFQWGIGVFIFVTCLLIAAYLAYRDLFIEKEALARSKPAVLTTSKTNLSFAEKRTLRSIEYRMEAVHGHSDPHGLEAERLEGILIGTLLERNCTRCGKPRNQMGDDLSGYYM